MINEDLQYALTAILQGVTPQREREGYSLGTQQVPHVKALIPKLREYARTQQWNGFQLSQVASFETEVEVQGYIDGRFPWTMEFIYANELMEDLFTGRWADAGKIEVQCVGGINGKPTVQLLSDGTSVMIRPPAPFMLRWDAGDAKGLRGVVERIFSRVTKVRIDGVIVDDHGGKLIAGGLTGWLLPELEWV